MEMEQRRGYDRENPIKVSLDQAVADRECERLNEENKPKDNWIYYEVRELPLV